LIYSGVLVALIGLLQQFFDFELIRQAVPPASTFGNKNLAGHFMVLVFPISLVFLFLAKHKNDFIKYGLFTFILGLFIFYIKSRSAWLAIFVEIIFGLAYLIYNTSNISKHKRWYVMLSFIIIILVGTIIIKINMPDFNNIDTSLTQNIEVNERVNPWLNTIGLIQENFVWLYGTGVGNWSIIYPKYFNYIGLDRTFSETAQLAHTHNDYLETFASVGLIGFLFLLWLFYLILQRVYKTNNLLVVAMALGLLGFGVTAFFSFPLKVFLPVLIVMLFIALIEKTLTLDNNKINFKVPKKFNLPIRVVVVVLMFMSISYAFNTLFSQHYYSKSLLAHNQNQWQKTLRLSKKSLEFNSFNHQSMFLQAKAYAQTQQLKKSIIAYKVLLKNKPYDSGAMFNLSAVYFNSADMKNGIKYLNQVLKLYPQNIKANLVLISLFEFQKNHQKAIAQYKKTKKIVLKQKTNYENLGDKAQTIKLYKEAKIAFQLAIQSAKKKDSAMAKLGIILFYYLNEKKQGLQLMYQALKLNPNVAQEKLLKKTLKPYIK
jgi:tetratricopeptide (TPR) repeat protein